MTKKPAPDISPKPDADSAPGSTLTECERDQIDAAYYKRFNKLPADLVVEGQDVDRPRIASTSVTTRGPLALRPLGSEALEILQQAPAPATCATSHPPPAATVRFHRQIRARLLGRVEQAPRTGRIFR